MQLLWKGKLVLGGRVLDFARRTFYHTCLSGLIHFWSQTQVATSGITVFSTPLSHWLDAPSLLLGCMEIRFLMLTEQCPLYVSSFYQISTLNYPTYLTARKPLLYNTLLLWLQCNAIAVLWKRLKSSDKMIFFVKITFKLACLQTILWLKSASFYLLGVLANVNGHFPLLWMK